MRETDLYPAIKKYLEKQGYEVKAEVNDCDVVAVREGEPPVIIELKLSLSMPLLIQAVDRQSLTDSVYVAIPKPAGKSANSLWKRNRRGLIKLCRRLGIGLITVDLKKTPGRATEVHCDPAPYAPRKNKRRSGRLLKEFSQRVGDPNLGGTNKTKIITSYRQDALRCLSFIDQKGAVRLKEIREQTQVDRAGGILQKDHYGWFTRVDRGIYDLTPVGKTALQTFSNAIAQL
ncbi:MAG: DUF2161 family putative PD-(D/E)XK-type phosphodiesterase [Hyphomicrobiaceae bacterium]|nr:DUF2161 family putative PD-(D/E)XK-type phosphodiesterase [Hyphomicrobiaceae bacterium]